MSFRRAATESCAEILGKLNGDCLSASVRLGDVQVLVEEIDRIRGSSAGIRPRVSANVRAHFSKDTILPSLVAELETA